MPLQKHFQLQTVINWPAEIAIATNLSPENRPLLIISKILISFFFRILSKFKQNKSENLGGDRDNEISSGDLPPPPFLLLSFVTEARDY